MQGKAKAEKLRNDMQRYAEGRRATKVQTLIDAGAEGRAELKRMREIRIPGSKRSPGDLWDSKASKGKQSNRAHGTNAKLQKINSGYQARQSQARGL